MKLVFVSGITRLLKATKNIYLLNTYHVPGTVLDTSNSIHTKDLPSRSLHSSGKRQTSATKEVNVEYASG